MSNSFVNFIVGGMYYSLLLSEIERHKDCYFAAAIKDEWNKDNRPIVINRDGVLFQYIFVYIHMGYFHLPYRSANDSLILLAAIRAEADYYNLPGLVWSCDEKIVKELPTWYEQQPTTALCAAYQSVRNGANPDELASVYGRNFFPTIKTDTLADKNIEGTIVGSSSVGTINVSELLGLSDELPDTPVCYNVRNYRGYPALNTDTIYSIKRHLPRTIAYLECEISSPDLIIMTEGSHWNNFCNLQDSYHHVGCIVYILQAAESGGAIHVTKHGITYTIRQAGEYVVNERDSTRQIAPITSGTLVLLIFPLKHDYTYYDDECFWEPRFDNESTDQEISTELATELINATLRELTHKDTSHGETVAQGVVLCLRKLYPLVGYDPSQNSMIINPDALEARDARLYALFASHFDISLVTVYVERRPRQYCESCVLGAALTESTFSDQDRLKMKIVVPPYGFGVPMQPQDPIEKVCSSLFTGLHIRLKSDTVI